LSAFTLLDEILSQEINEPMTSSGKVTTDGKSAVAEGPEQFLLSLGELRKVEKDVEII